MFEDVLLADPRAFSRRVRAVTAVSVSAEEQPVPTGEASLDREMFNAAARRAVHERVPSKLSGGRATRTQREPTAGPIRGGSWGGGYGRSVNGPGRGSGRGQDFGPGSGSGMGRCRPVRVRVCRRGGGDGGGPRCRIVEQLRC
jgi:hypothetical protein